MAQAPLTGIERHKLGLSETVTKLEKALKYWQDWEIEYLGLVEELEDGGGAGEVTAEKLSSIAHSLSSQLLNEKEIQGLLPRSRPAAEVVATIQRRIDYVRDNQKSIQKQLDAAQAQLELTNDLIKDAQDEQGLPLMEITEELDEQGNVISGKTAAATDKAGDLVSALQKVGLLDKPKDEPEPTEKKEVTPVAPGDKKTITKEDSPEEIAAKDNPKPKKQKGRVKIVEPEAPRASEEEEEEEDDKEAEFARFLKTPEGAKFMVIDDNDTIISNPIIPADEPADEARLRKEMLDYNSAGNAGGGIEEMQNIVAEIDLEDDEMEPEMSDDDLTEDEDEHIRPRGNMLDPAYVAEMLALDRKLNGKPEPAPVKPKSLLKMDVLPEEELSTAKAEGSSSKEKRGKKSVRFAEELDVAPTGSKDDVAPQRDPERPIIDQVFERKVSALPRQPSVGEKDTTGSSSAVPPEPPKISKFKAQRQAAAALTPAPSRQRAGPDMASLSLFPASKPPPVNKRSPLPPPGPSKVLSGSIIERVPQVRSSEEVAESPQPPSPSTYNEDLHKQEIATEYYKQRNKRIHAQGGFLEDQNGEAEEAEIQPLDSEDADAPKVSRFMAARLKRS